MDGARNFFVTVVLLLAYSGSGYLSASENPVEHGRYLYFAAGCACCHSSEQPLAGGRPIDTPFGTFYAPNITPDLEHGIGNWTEEDFYRALNDGISPSGEHYFPVFPYSSYTQMTDSDKSALWAYISSQPAVPASNRPHDLSWYLFSRKLMGPWKQGHFNSGSHSYDPSKTSEWNRGAYLVNAVGHCGECHTPRGLLGGQHHDLYLAGSRNGPGGERVPNITPDPRTGIGKWSHKDLTTFLATGLRPDGRYAQGSMAEVLSTSVMPLTDNDRHAVATYLLSIPPVHHDVHTASDLFEGYSEDY